MRQWILVVVPAVLLVGVGIFVGALLGGAFDSGGSSGEISASAVPPAAIGNADRGKEIWMAKGCTMCHSFAGAGGTDAPALDFMRGNLSVHSIAGMSGTIWNHLPGMLARFRQEKIPFPTISPDEMADLTAYLHSGGAPSK